MLSMKVAYAALPVRGCPIVYAVMLENSEENCAAAIEARAPPKLQYSVFVYVAIVFQTEVPVSGNDNSIVWILGHLILNESLNLIHYRNP